MTQDTMDMLAAPPNSQSINPCKTLIKKQQTPNVAAGLSTYLSLFDWVLPITSKYLHHCYSLCYMVARNWEKAVDVDVSVRPTMVQIPACWSASASMQEYRCKSKIY